MHNNIFPSTAHSAITCCQTRCSKTVFPLDLLEGCYRGVFKHIAILCPTVKHNETYKQREWIWTDDEIYVVDPAERLQD